MTDSIFDDFFSDDEVEEDSMIDSIARWKRDDDDTVIPDELKERVGKKIDQQIAFEKTDNPFHVDAAIAEMEENFFDTEIDLEIAEIASKIAAIHSVSDERRVIMKKLKGDVDPLDEMRREAQRKVDALREQIALIQQQIRSEEYGIDDDKLKVEALEKQKAALIAKRAEEQGAKQLVNFLNKLMANFEPWIKARDYQKEDIVATVEAWRNGKNGMLNANDMSLGKTFETIVTLWIITQEFIKQYGRAPKTLWLTKSTLVKETPKEIKHWVPEWLIMALDGSKSPETRELSVDMAVRNNAMLLTNYEVCRTTPLVRNIEWDIVIIDEVHKLKGGANASGPTAIWSVVKDVCRKSKFTFMLSGTPIVAQPEEMWSYLHIFAPDRFPTLRDFKRKYAGMQNIAGEYQWAIDANKLLSQGLRGQMIRRSVSEVGIEMPELTEIVRTLEMTAKQRKLYDQLRKQFWIWLDEQEGKALTAMAIIAQLIRLRQINTWPAGIKIVDPDTKKVTHLDLEESAKVDECMDIISEQIDAEESVVVSCTFNGPLHEIKRRCELLMIPCDVLTGETKDETGIYAERFRQNKGRVLCLNSAMGEGLNLHKMPDRWPGGARTIIHIDKWYTPARNEQVERRVYRLGIKEGATAYYLRNEESVDDFLDAILAERMEKIGSIMDSDEIRPSADWKQFLKDKI